MHAVNLGVDVGHYLPLLRDLVGSEGHVTCIEPSPENLRELRANIAANTISNVTLHTAAVGEAKRTVSVRSGINSGIVLSEEAAGDGVGAEDGVAIVGTATIRPFASLIDRLADLLKIDIDGFEGGVIQSSLDVIQRDRPTILLEPHPRCCPHPKHPAEKFSRRCRRRLRRSVSMTWPD